jgi:hypothetical protein
MASFVSMTKAATVTLYLTTVNATTSGGTWQLYMADSDDNDGLANYDVDIVGSGGAVVSAAPTIKAPRPTDPSGQYADGNSTLMGFNTSVSGGGVIGTGRSGITAGQDTVYGGTDDSTFDMGILVGVGQMSPVGSVQNGSQGPWDGNNANGPGQGTPTGLAITSTSPWAYTTPGTIVAGGTGAGGALIVNYPIGGTIVEQGTYTTTNQQGFLSANVDGFVEVLGTSDNGSNELWDLVHQQGNTPQATILANSDGQGNDSPNVNGDIIALNVPEPTSLGLIAVGMGLAATGRRMRRKTA